MDVHKNFLVACIATTDERNHTTHQIRRFSTFAGDLRRLSDWLAAKNCRDVCMESSGRYWIPVFNTLEKTCNVCLTHPKYVKAIKGKKTDKKDAKWISELFKLCSWAGLNPQNQESAGKKKTTRIGRGGDYLKPFLVQIVLAVTKSEKHPELKNKHQSLKKRRGRKKATIAIARKILTAVWHILSKNEPYHAELYHQADKPLKNRELITEQAFALLRKQGYSISDRENVTE